MRSQVRIYSHAREGPAWSRRGTRLRGATAGGFTFIELLTVVTVIGILVGLLLPALQSAREAVRRMQCSQNLQQVILAIQVYESAFGVYPPGTINNRRPILTQPVGYHHNWICQILPHLEESNLQHEIDRKVSVYDPQHAQVRLIRLPVLTCPSSGALKVGYSDYAGVHHSVEAPIDIDNDGVFFLNSCIGHEDILDGLSNTLFVGEKTTLAGDLGWMSGTRATLRNSGVSLNLVPGIRAWAATPPVDSETWGPAEPPLAGEELLGALFGPLGAAPYRSSSRWAGDPAPPFRRPTNPLVAVGGFGSTHPGGAQFALGDGSVRFQAETMDITIYSYMANRADLEMTGYGY